MKRNLLIIGAGIYSAVAAEVAESMDCFEKISFADDNAKTTFLGANVVGDTSDLKSYCNEFDCTFVAIGNPKTRLNLLQRIEKETNLERVTLISPKAYVSPSAKLHPGCIIEPMAVVHSGCTLGIGCIISAGAVINHGSVLEDGVHADCNATVSGNTLVQAEMKIEAGTVFRNLN